MSVCRLPALKGSDGKDVQDSERVHLSSVFTAFGGVITWVLQVAGLCSARTKPGRLCIEDILT